MKPRVNRSHASTRQLRRVSVDHDREPMDLAGYVDEVPGLCDICRSSDMALHIPIAGTSTASASDGKLRSVFLVWMTRSRCARGAFSPNSLLMPARSDNLVDVWDVFRGSRIASSGKPECIRMDEGGEWEMKLGRTPARNLALGPGFGARAIREMVLLVAFTTDWRQAIDFRASRSPLRLWRLETLLSASGSAVNQLVICSNPADLFGRGVWR